MLPGNSCLPDTALSTCHMLCRVSVVHGGPMKDVQLVSSDMSPVLEKGWFSASSLEILHNFEQRAQRFPFT